MKPVVHNRRADKILASGFQVEKFTWLPLLIIEAITALFYLPSLWYPFQFDDVAHVTKRFAIRHDNPLARWWCNRRWLGDWINSLNFKMGEFNPLTYRITNVFIHMATGVLVYYLVLMMCKNLESSLVKRYGHFIAFCTTGLFLMHPLQTQAVSYVIQARIEGVASFFILLNILLFVRYAQAKTQIMRIVFFALLAFTSLLACGTKEIFVLAPVLMALVDFTFLSRGSISTMIKERGRFYFVYGVFFLALVAWYIFDFRIFPGAGKAAGFQSSIGDLLSNENNLGNVLTHDPNARITPFAFFISQFKTVAHYFNLVFWPFAMSVEYDWVLARGLMTFEVLFSLMQLLVIAAIALYSIIRRQLLLAGFGLVWFFVVLAPRSSFIPSAELVCDYKSYLAVVGVFMALATLIAAGIEFLKGIYGTFEKHSNSWQLYTAVMVFLFLPVGTATYFRNKVWSSNVLFWEDCAKKAPNKARVHNNFGVALCESNKFEQAIEHYEKAIALDRFYQDPLSNVAVAYTMLGRHEPAIKALKEAIRLCPSYPEAYNNLASIYIDNKKYDEAEQNLTKAIELRPYYGKAYFNRARISEMRADYEGVFTNLKKATEGDLDTVSDAHFKLGQAAFKLQKFEDALAAFAQVVRLEPQSTLGWFNYANAHHLCGNHAESSKIYERLVQLDPKDYRYSNNLAESYVALKEYQKALSLFEKLTKFEKFSGDVLFRIVECHEKMKNHDKAKEFLAGIPLEGTPEEFRVHVKREIARFDLQSKLLKKRGVSLRDIQNYADLNSHGAVKLEEKDSKNRV
jgi:tetratricopeptide (TPR) repeat protein